MRSTLLEELAISEDIVRKGVEVVPRFRVTTPDGDYRILMPLSDDMAKRERGMRLMGAFMAWKQASAFVLASELKEPDAIVAFAACRDGHAAVMRLIEREPLSFDDDQWLEESQIGSEVPALLRSGEASIDRETETDLKRLFGEGGEYQAHKLN